MENAITIFGTFWCRDCIRVRRFLDKNNIAYHWVDIDKDESGEEFVFTTNHGMRSVPTILFKDGSILVEPNDVELEQMVGTRLPSS
ncbi:MAG: NrdH-redoxin [Chloroflexi bacterium RBG_16_47_49]|nr:MAG: NrdH-redoxin [Chloroflexi bacterium RBG_16_47_49]